MIDQKTSTRLHLQKKKIIKLEARRDELLKSNRALRFKDMENEKEVEFYKKIVEELLDLPDKKVLMSKKQKALYDEVFGVANFGTMRKYK